MAQDATLATPSLAAFLAEINRVTDGLRNFQVELGKRLNEQSEALVSVSEAIRKSGGSEVPGWREILLQQSKRVLNQNQTLLDLQIDEDLDEKKIKNIRASIQQVGAAQQESLDSVAGVYSELFPRFKTGDLFKDAEIGNPETLFRDLAGQIIKGASALRLQPQALARAVILAARHADVANTDLKVAANVLALTAQKAKLAPGEIEKSLPKFQLAFDGMGLKGSASLAEFGALAQVSKDFGGSWRQRSRLWSYFLPNCFKKLSSFSFIRFMQRALVMRNSSSSFLG